MDLILQTPGVRKVQGQFKYFLKLASERIMSVGEGSKITKIV